MYLLSIGNPFQCVNCIEATLIFPTCVYSATVIWYKKKNIHKGGNHETGIYYPADAANLFMQIAKVEAEHEKRYKKLLEMIEKGTVYKREKPTRWKCSKCGYIHTDTEPPEKCPSCKHAREYYEPECLCFEEGCEKCN